LVTRCLPLQKHKVSRRLPRYCGHTVARLTGMRCLWISCTGTPRTSMSVNIGPSTSRRAIFTQCKVRPAHRRRGRPQVECREDDITYLVLSLQVESIHVQYNNNNDDHEDFLCSTWTKIVHASRDSMHLADSSLSVINPPECIHHYESRMWPLLGLGSEAVGSSLFQ
jgi:hypothetical protein